MTGSWWDAIGPLAVSVLALIVPGVVVILAGWGWTRSSSLLLLAPAVSSTVVALAATLAPLIGLPWSITPVVITTVLSAAAAFLVRRFTGTTRPEREAPAFSLTALLALGAAGAVLLYKFAGAFVGPEAIAQRFDNIVHLNTIAYAVDTANASPFHIGNTSDIPFYPNGWHSLVSLTALVTGASTPMAINVANLAIVALLWPASVLAFISLIFPKRKVALVVAAGLTPAFGAFPALFFNWGVLYPNALGYAMIPAVLAAVVLLCRARHRGDVVRAALVLALLIGGSALGHPNSILAAFLFGTGLAVALLGREAYIARTRSSIRLVVIVFASAAAAFLVIWPLVRTSAEHSRWVPGNTFASAFGQGVLGMPREWNPTMLVVVLLLAGIIVIIRRPSWLTVGFPFATAVLLFVVCSGFPQNHWLRQWLTNPWYNDPNRLAALLPIVAIPVATLGAVAIVQLVLEAVRRSARLRRVSDMPIIRIVAVAAIGVLALSTAAGANIRMSLAQVKEAYTPTEDARILSIDELALLDRLPEEVPADALIAGNPRTGTSLAYAVSDRQVLRKHIFGVAGPDELYLNLHLRNIATDPQVCAAIDRLGVDYVLDFGDIDAFGDDEYARSEGKKYAGMLDIPASDHLKLIDSEGPDAKLFEVEGC